MAYDLDARAIALQGVGFWPAQMAMQGLLAGTRPLPPVPASVYAEVFALFSRLTLGTTPAFKTATRKVRHWADLPSENQPALFQAQLKESANYRKGLPTVWDFELALMLYVHTNSRNNPTVVPASMLNPLVDLVEAAVIVDDIANNACTLGGLVSHCAIEGDITYYEGTLGDNAVAVVPVRVRTYPIHPR